MIEVTNIDIYNFKNAIRGMRNPLESWDKSDSKQIFHYGIVKGDYIIGDNDLELALKLIKAGTDHSKFMRQIFVSMNIYAPRYWWTEMDTYKVATVANSESTMHRLGSRLLEYEDFSWDDESEYRQNTLAYLNDLIIQWQQTKDKDIWRTIIQDLPQSFNQMRTWTGNYQVLRNIYHSRKNHKLQEWKDFCGIVEGLPNSILITKK